MICRGCALVARVWREIAVLHSPWGWESGEYAGGCTGSYVTSRLRVFTMCVWMKQASSATCRAPGSAALLPRAFVLPGPQVNQMELKKHLSIRRLRGSARRDSGGHLLHQIAVHVREEFLQWWGPMHYVHACRSTAWSLR